MGIIDPAARSGRHRHRLAAGSAIDGTPGGTTSRPALRGSRTTSLALLAVMVLLAAVVLVEPVQAEEADAGQVALAMLDDGTTGGTVGFYLKQVDGPVHLSHNESFVFEPASSVKALLHFHAMRQVEDGAIVDGQPVTLARLIPWTADATRFDGNGLYVPGGADCPTDNTVPMSTPLTTVLQWTMANSDNATTQGLRDFFGDADINATRVALGMDDTALNHVIGCGGPVPNELTLVDAGKLYEAVATGFLADPDAAYQLMIGGGGPGTGGYDTIIDEEAAGLGLSTSALNAFKALPRVAGKGGSYGISGKLYLSNAGWGQLSFKDADCAIVPREFVFGSFVHGADASTVNLSDLRREMFRPQIRSALESWAACQADLEVNEVSIVDPPTEIDVNTPVSLTVRHSVVNNGPATTMDAELATTVSAPNDCTVAPDVADQPVTLPVGVVQVIDHEVVVECADPSFHLLEVDADIAPANPAVVDPDGSNNADTTSETVAVLAHADLAVTDLDLSALDGAGLGDLLVGQEFVLDVPLTLHNFGDTGLGLYHDPVDGDVTRTLVVPAGVTGSVHITTTEAPATVVVEPDGQMPETHVNQVAGSTISASGPATLTVHSVAGALEVDDDREVATSFGLHCDAPGLHDIGFAAAIEPSDPHVVDPQSGNDSLEAARTIDCVTPVQINIRPGNAGNLLNPASVQTVPVAILTTDAGEYGLPLAFDATSVHHPSVRFATAATLNDGGGSSAHPDRAFLRDSFELDDQTRDGDDDLTLLFALPGTGVDDQTTEACTVGTYQDGGGEVLTFYGCDTVHTTANQS